MADQVLDLGGAGQLVAENVHRLRGELSYAELSRRLEAAGWPIPVLGLRRIEKGTRRVSVDDLVALAAVLGVSPLTLLLPADASQSATTELTGAGAVSHEAAWRWALGELPLDDDDVLAVESYRRRAVPSGLRQDQSTWSGYVVKVPGGREVALEVLLRGLRLGSWSSQR